MRMIFKVSYYVRSNYENKADKVIVLSDTYYKGCLLRRNDFMLQHSNFVIAYYDGKQKGGTYYTCREARKRGMTVVNLFFYAKHFADSDKNS